VQFVLQHERRHDLLFASQQSATGREMFDKYHINISPPGSMVLLEDNVPYIRSDATLKVMRLMGGAWKMLATLGWLIPRPLRDYAYTWVARNRGKFSASCSVKHRAEFTKSSDRFLDDPAS
jgi:predicted DCC family thiol-disulfide oxidoreductase YuxK